MLSRERDAAIGHLRQTKKNVEVIIQELFHIKWSFAICFLVQKDAQMNTYQQFPYTLSVLRDRDTHTDVLNGKSNRQLQKVFVVN